MTRPHPTLPARERPPMRDACGTLRDRWYVACLSTELAGRRPLGRVILEEHLVLFRDTAGAAVCLLDRCLHRNAMLSGGSVDGGRIVCPYHGWHYDASGACVHVPSEGPASCGHPGRRVDRFPVREQDGLIWVWLGDPGDVRGDPFPVPFRNDGGWRSYYMVTRFDNDVTNCVENFMDVPHTVFVHSGWFRSRTLHPVRATVERTADSVLVTYDHSTDAIGFTHLMVNPRRDPVRHTDRFYMPNVTRVDYEFGTSRAFVITSQCTPVRPRETLVYTAISFRLGLANALARRLLPPYTRVVIAQDVRIMKNQGQSLERYPPAFSNTAADAIHRYIEVLREWAEAGEPGPAPRPARCEVEFHV